MKRDFKGVWIPKEIWVDKNLTWQEKVMLVEIDSLNNEQGCYATNKYFADFFGISETRVSQIINSLKKKGYIQVEFIYNGKEIDKRILKSNIKVIVQDEVFRNSKEGYLENLKGVFRNSKGGYLENLKENNTIFNNTMNNTELNNTVSNSTNTVLNSTLSNIELNTEENKILVIDQVLNELKQIKGYPFDCEKDTEFIHSLLADFPELDILEEIKKWRTYKLDKPLKKNSNPRLQFRNWCKKAADWQKKRTSRQQKETTSYPRNEIPNLTPLPDDEKLQKFLDSLPRTEVPRNIIEDSPPDEETLLKWLKSLS